MMNKFKKISSVVPGEDDFVDGILSLKEHRKKLGTLCNCHCTSEDIDDIDDMEDIRWSYVFKVESAEIMFSDKFSKVLDEFPRPCQVDPLYAIILDQRYNLHHYAQALEEVFHAGQMIDHISSDYMELLSKDDCYTLEQCKSLKVTALACMFTVAKRCIPNLAYLEKVRQYMANLEDDAATLKNKYNVLAGEDDYPVPQGVYVDNIADFVDPETLFWLEELDTWPHAQDDDQEVDCEELKGLILAYI